MPAKKIAILIAEPQELVADALAIALGRETGLRILEDFPSSAAAAIDAAGRLSPDVVLADYWMPDMEGPAMTRLLLRRAPGAKVVILSWFFGPNHIREVLDAGAAGFLPRSVRVATVADAVRRAHAGESPIYPAELEELARTIDNRYDANRRIWQRLKDLSQRELEVLTLLSMGLTNKDIAGRLFVAPGTVKVHVHNMLRKSGASGTTELVALARQCGLIV